MKQLLTCNEVIDFLDAYVDGSLPAHQRLAFEDHLAACRDCRAYLREYRMTMRLASTLAQEQSDLDSVPDGVLHAVRKALCDQS